MKDNQFDRIIRERLENLRPPFQPGSWEQFEQQLDAADAGVPEPDDQVIDEVVFQKLHRLEQPYRAVYWNAMAERLDREFVRPDEVLRFKAMELALLVLLLFTIWNALPTHLQSLPDAARTEATAEAAPSGANGVMPGAEALRTAPPTDALTPPAPLPQEAGRIQAPAANLPNREAAIPMPPLKPGGSKLLETPPASLPDNTAPPAPPGDVLPPAAGLILPPAPAVTPLADARVDIATNLAPGTSPRYLHFGMFGSLDYNRIITPPDRFLDVETRELDRYELGYSGGFSVALELQRWEIQTGLIYSSKNYQPSALIVQSGNFRDGYGTERLKDIELNIIHIPLNFRYNLFHYDKTRFYVLAGASLQVATLGNYYVEGESSRRSSVLSQYIENGWFEGGTFRDNSYLTGNLGFGLEHFVTTRWSVFAQPTYQHALNFFQQGLGATHDRISTMSIYSGIRVRLER